MTLGTARLHRILSGYRLLQPECAMVAQNVVGWLLTRTARPWKGAECEELYAHARLLLFCRWRFRGERRARGGAG